MKFTLLHVFTFFSVALVASHTPTPEAYWKSVLPNSPMPKAIKDHLYSTEWNNVADSAGGPPQGPNVGVGRGGIGVHYPRQGKTGSVGVHPGKSPFVYNYVASEDQLKDDPNVALFFFENDLQKGKEMKLHFTNNDQKSMFLPRKIADSIPFSSNSLQQIYKRFSVKPDSVEAENIKQTLNECEDKGIDGEEKYCATSLESMIGFVTTKLGQKAKAVSTEVNARKSSTLLQKYTIEVVKKFDVNKVVVCHKENYVYTVFYCYKTVGTRVYAVSMVGEDGMRVNVMAVCHIDTAKWNPKHLAFQVLKVKPGSVPICHFLPEDHVVWIPY